MKPLNFFRNRKLWVVLNGQCSSWANVSVGIPQGSILNPIFFLIKSVLRIFFAPTVKQLRMWEDL